MIPATRYEIAGRLRLLAEAAERLSRDMRTAQDRLCARCAEELDRAAYVMRERSERIAEEPAE